MFFTSFSLKKGALEGGYCYGLMALSWDPVVIFT